jgi:hypothetical protein
MERGTVSLSKSDIVKKLRDDNEYYNGIGLEFISNSDIKLILESPRSFASIKADPSLREHTTPMILGNLLHTAILEPHKVDDKFIVVDASSRATKRYKEMAQETHKNCVLINEYNNIMACVERLINNGEIQPYLEGLKEVPNIDTLFGLNFKCKADIWNQRTKTVVDIKTTSDINNFHYSARKYYYNSQSYIYKSIFDAEEFVFIVVDKYTHDVGIFKTSDEFIDNGKNIVKQAVTVYNRFFTENSLENVNDYIIKNTL